MMANMYDSNSSNSNTDFNNTNPDNEFHNSIPADPEIEQPNPSIATPSIPDEMPVREG
jgi:hypothetical protein